MTSQKNQSHLFERLAVKFEYAENLTAIFNSKRLAIAVIADIVNQESLSCDYRRPRIRLQSTLCMPETRLMRRVSLH